MHAVDVVVIGAGAAGVAAARRLSAAPLSVLVLEGRSRVGGRAWTMREPSGLPLDLGCGWLHSADENEWSAIARELGFAIDPLPPPWARPAHQANFSAAEQEDYWAAWDRFYTRLDEAADSDRPAAVYLEPGCRWNALLDAMSSYINGAELDRLSVGEFLRYRDTGVNWRVVAGYGALVEACAAGQNVTLDCPATLIDHAGRRVRIATARGDILARAAIITVPPPILASEALRFSPALPAKMAAAHALPLGLADKVFLRVDGADDLSPETRLFGAIDRTATGSYHLRPFGRPVIEGYFGGEFARALEADGRFAHFAIEQIAALLGGDMRRRLIPIAASSWGRDPWARGSYSYGSPGAAAARAVLAAPVDNRLFFAGEACSACDFSTAHGAYRTGVAAAEQVIRALRTPAPQPAQ
jgi:monoamine oxidase